MDNTFQKLSCAPNFMHLLSFYVSLSVLTSLRFSAEEIIPTTYSFSKIQGLLALGNLSLILLPSSLKREYIHYNHIFCSFKRVMWEVEKPLLLPAIAMCLVFTAQFTMVNVWKTSNHLQLLVEGFLLLFWG